MTQRFATVDPANLGAQLELRDGGRVLTYDTTGTTIARNARATQGVATGKHYWECVVFGDEPQVATTAVVGLVLGATGNNVAPGVATTTVGYRPGDGSCWQSGASIATVATAPLRSVIGVALDLDSPSKTLTIYVNRLAVYSFVLSAGQIWFPAHTVSGAVVYGHSMFINYGSRSFECDVSDGFRHGVYTTSQPFNTLRLASEDWMSPHDAKEANIPYAGHIRNPAQFAIDKQVTFWMWGERNSSFSSAQLEVQDDGTYDELTSSQPRGARVLLKLANRDDPSAEPRSLGSAIFVQANEDGADAIRIQLRDPLTLLDLAVRRRYHLPYVAEGTANRLIPIALGACRNIDLDLVDATRRAYVMHDGPLTQIVAVRDMGDKLDPLAAPPDWSVTSDRRGVELQTEAQGKLSADVSSSGVSEIVGAPDIDVVQGYGAMTALVSGMPSEWFAIAAYMFHAVASRVATSGGRLRLETSGIIPANPSVAWDVRFRDLRTQRDWLPVKKGCYYRLTFKIVSSYWPTAAGFSQFAAGWRVKGVGVSGDAGGVSTTLVPGEYTIDFRATCDGTLAWFGSGLIDPANNGGSTGPWWCEIDDVVCLLKSADTPDRLGGYGNFIGPAGTNWTALTVSAGCSISYSTVVSADYPAGIGAALMAIAAGAGKVVQIGYVGLGSALPAGRTYRIAVRVDDSTANARLRVVAQHAVSGVQTTVATLLSSSLEATFQVGAASFLVLEGFTIDAAVGTVKVSMARCVDITDQLSESSTNSPLNGISLTDYARHVIEERAELGAAAWEPADAEDIDSATGYIFGVRVRESITGRALLSAPLDSFTGALTTDEDDRIRIVRLFPPELAGDGDVVWDIDRINAPSRPTMTPDDAPGLTTRAGARRNWSLHTDSDFVKDFDPITGIDAASRTRFKRTSQYVVSSANTLADMYASAYEKDPIDLLLDLPEHAQAEIDRVTAMYAVPRAFWRCTAYYDDWPPPVRPGRIVRLTWPRPGLESGLKLYVCRSRHIPTEQCFEITGWGRRRN